MAFDSPSLDVARETLERVWGHADFRGLQAEVVREVLAGRDVLAVLPTGGGKSVCYQVPALIRPGLGLVVSPLIALMTDQVEALRQQGVRAARLDSGLSLDARSEVLRAARSGAIESTSRWIAANFSIACALARANPSGVRSGDWPT